MVKTKRIIIDDLINLIYNYFPANIQFAVKISNLLILSKLKTKGFEEMFSFFVNYDENSHKKSIY